MSAYVICQASSTSLLGFEDHGAFFSCNNRSAVWRTCTAHADGAPVGDEFSCQEGFGLWDRLSVSGESYFGALGPSGNRS
jgi:hypothetical protein